MPTDGSSDAEAALEHAVRTEAADGPVAPTEDRVEAAKEGPPGPDMAYADARRVLWPWVAQRSRPQVVALILMSCLALGPIVALVAIMDADPTPVHTVLDAPLNPAEVTRVTATVLGLSPAAGEMRVRVLVDPADDLSDDGGRLLQPISVVINDVSGATTRSYEAGQVPTPFEAALPLAEGSVTRYPFDRYRGSLLIVVSDESGRESEPRLVSIEARSVIDDFVVKAGYPADVDAGPRAVTVVEWTASRPPTTTVYALWLMLLMWGLAVTGLLIMWAVVIWMIDIPFWVFGYFVGVLFALPPLRDSLPGRPPPGTIFDFGSFYWSITIIGANLILVLAIWLRRTHAEERLRSLDPSRPD